MSSTNGFSFSAIVTNDNRILRDHRVHGTRIMPGVTFLDMIYRLLKAKGFALREVELRNILFIEPLATTEDFDQKLQISLKMSSDVGLITVSSVKIRNNQKMHSEWVQNCTCELHQNREVLSESLNLNDLKQKALEKKNIEFIYNDARKVGTVHFEFMKGLGDVYVNSESLLAEIRLGELAANYVNDFYLHPALLDCSTFFPFLFHRIEVSDQKPFIPIFIESFRAFKPLEDQCFVYVEKPKKMNQSTDVVHNAYKLYNADGTIVASFKKLTAKQIRAKGLITKLKNVHPTTNDRVEESSSSAREREDLVSIDREDKEIKKADSRGSLKKVVQSMIADMQNIPVDDVKLNTGFYDLGLESTGLLKLGRMLEQKLEAQLYPTLLFEYPTINKLADYIEKEMGINLPLEDKVPSHQPGNASQMVFLTTHWKETPIDNKHRIDGDVLVFNETSELSAGLQQHLNALNSNFRTIQVKPGAAFRELSNGSYEICPQSPEDYLRLINELKQQGIIPTTIIHMWSKERFTDDETSLLDQLHRGVYSLVFLSKALMRLVPKQKSQVLVIHETSQDEPQPQYLAIGALVKTIHKEHPKLSFKSIEIDAHLNAKADIILSELRTEPFKSADIRYRDKQRYIAQIGEVTPLPSDVPTDEGLHLKERGVYLITGGAGGLGLIFAEYLAKSVKAKLVLVGRSKLSSQQQTKIEALKAAGSQVLYLEADVSIEQDVTDIYNKARQTFGKINGVIHAAGVIRDSLVLNKTPDEIKDVVAPKVFGTVFLDKVTRNEKMDFFVMFSSVAATFGNVGQSDYAYGNSFMDNFSAWRETLGLKKKRYGKTVSVNWPLWLEGGMNSANNEASSKANDSDIWTLSTTSGLNAFSRCLTLQGSGIAVLEGDREAIREMLRKLAQGNSSESSFNQESNSQQENHQPDSRDDAVLVKETDESNDIAIIGVSGRYPMAKNLDEYWENLKSGKDCITEVPKERWDVKSGYDPDKNKSGTIYHKWGGFIDDVDKFDPLFFNIPPKQAAYLDPQERLFMTTVHHTLEDAGYTKSALSKETVGVFVGVMWGEYQLLGAEQSKEGALESYSSPFASISNRISYFFDFHGPSMSIDTMCSSSLTAVHLACESIRSGDIDCAIAGGVNISIHQNKYIQLSQLKLASSEGKSRSFGEGGDGYVPGEGVGAILLKPLNRAKEDNDHIYAVVKASSLNHGGRTSGFTVPNPKAQADLILNSLTKANINPNTISYIEAQSTGTPLGDQIEIKGLSDAFRKFTDETQFCSIGSVKANIGHLESASGISQLTKVLLQMKHKQLVPSIHSEVLNTTINFSDSPFYVQHNLSEWKQPAVKDGSGVRSYPRRAGINSFGAGGANAQLVLEEYEIPMFQKKTSGIGPQIIVLSAMSRERLKSHAKNMALFFEKETITQLEAKEKSSYQSLALNIANIAYTLQIGREALEERAAFIVSDVSELLEKLNHYLLGHENIDNVVTGNTLMGETTLSHLPEGKERQNTITDALVRKDFLQLAEWWVNGEDIEWDLLYSGEKPTRIPLPLYPFAQERYWISERRDTSLSLLDHNESTFDQISWKKTFSGTEFFIKDHSDVLPAVVHLEMIRRAGNLAKPSHRIAKINDIVFSNPLIISDTTKDVSVNLFLQKDRYNFKISSLAEDNKRTHHSQGIFSYTDQPEDESLEKFVDIDAILNRCQGKDNDIEKYYQKVLIGKNFQGIKQFAYNDREALSSIELNLEQAKDRHQFGLHPTLTDSAIQTMVALGYRTGLDHDLIYLPYVLQEIEILDISSTPQYVHAWLANAESSDEKKYNALLLSKEGRVLVALKELTVRPIKEKPESIKPILEEAIVNTDSSAATPSFTIYSNPTEKHQDRFQDGVLDIVSDILELSKDKVSPKKNMSDYGFDSILFTQLSEKIGTTYDIRITPDIFFGHSTIESIVKDLFKKYKEAILHSGKIESDATIESTNETPVNPPARQETHLAVSQVNPLDSGRSSRTDPQEVAVIGMHGVFPLSDDVYSFWQNLSACKSMITEIPKDRWDWKSYYQNPVQDPNKTNIKWGGFINEVDKFDALFFNISPREAEYMDPQLRVFLETVWKTIEDGGYRASDLSGTDTGLFVGVTTLDYNTLGAQQFHFMISNRTSYFLDIHGPSESIDTGCSSSLVATHRAIELIRSGRSKMAIAGGVNVILDPNLTVSMTHGGMLSESGQCYTFDKRANGYVRSEGSGAILLKALSAAEADGDHIYGIIKESALNHGGKTNSPTAPNPAAQERLLVGAYQKAGIDPASVTYIETHGTGTILGDPIEINGLKNAFRKLYTARGIEIKERHLGLGSVKSNIGHLESAAGIAGIIKVLLAIKHETLPGNANFKEINPYIDLNDSPFFIVDKTIPWKSLIDENGDQIPRRAGISSFGIGGANGHVIIEEYKNKHLKAAGRITQQNLVVLSAKSNESLMQMAENMLDFLNLGDTSTTGNLKLADQLDDLAYTLQVGREPFEFRLAIIAGDIKGLKEHLVQCLEGKSNPNVVLHRDKETIASDIDFLIDGDEGKEYLQNLIRNRKLYKLARLWVSGADIDWNLLYPEQKPNRMPLPTYPFARDRHWLPEALKTPIHKSLPSANHFLHPLLHQNTSDLTELRFSSSFSGQEFFLSDHLVNGDKVLPGVAFLEMARAAIEQVASRMTDETVGVKLKNVVWLRPVIVTNQALKVHIGISTDDSDQIQFEVYTIKSNGSEDYIIHAQGSCELTPLATVPLMAVDSLRSEMNKGVLGSDQCYQEFSASGLDYGIGHRAVEEVYLGENQVLAKLELPASMTETLDHYVLHPSLMDAAFQGSVGLEKTLDNEVLPLNPTLPFALQELDVFRNCTRNMYAWIRYSKNKSASDRVKKVDLDLVDDQGNVCVRMKGLSSRILERESVETKPVNSVGVLTTHPVWQAKPVLMDTAPTGYSHHFVLLCGLEEISPAIVESSLQRSSCHALQSKETGLAARFQDYALQTFLYIKEILQQKAKGNQLLQLVVGSNEAEQFLPALSAILKTARLENPRFNGQVILISRNETAKSLVEKLKSNSLQTPDTEIRYLKDERQIRSWPELPKNVEATGSPWKEGGVYLLTGGIGGLGLLIAHQIIDTTKSATLILSGRSSLNNETKAKLHKLRKSGTRVEYRQADVASEDQIRKLVQSMVEDFGVINGIVHCAGVISDNFIIRKNIEEFKQVLVPKVSGTINLDAATKDLKLDFFVLFSSGTAVTGNIGQADYAVANAFMDWFAKHRNMLAEAKKRKGRTISINWPLWKEGGMNVDEADEQSIEQRFGTKPMPKEVGFNALKTTLACDHGQVAVTYGELEQIRKKAFDKPEGQSTIVRESQTVGEHSVPIESLDMHISRHLKTVLSTELKLPEEKIETHVNFEKYGVDSIMQMQIIKQLETIIGSSPKTLLFEYTNIDELTEYLMEEHQGQFETFVKRQEKADHSHIAEAAENAESGQENIAKNLNKPNSRKMLLGRWKSSKESMQRDPETTKLSVRHDPVKTGEQLNNAKEINKYSNDPVAIVGLAGRYPESPNLDRFWENLKSGKNCITKAPQDRFKGLNRGFETDDPIYGGFITGIDEFDHDRFEIGETEAGRMSPEQKLFLEIVGDALQDSGYSKDSLWTYQSQQQKGVGVYVGTMYNQSQYNEENIDAAILASNSHDWEIANRVSHCFNLVGPSMSLSTACSSSLTAIYLAIQALRSGETAMAIAGGINLTLSASKFKALKAVSFLGSGNRSKPFGKGSGYIPGEGVGAVILKPLKEAIKDNNKIYGVIRSCHINHVGGRQVYTAPDPVLQANLIRKTLEEAAIDIDSIQYIEAASNGSPLGDPIEVVAIKRAFKGLVAEEEFCSMGTVKSNIGHLEAASGISQLTKVLLQMKYKQLVASIHAEPLNSNIKLKSSPVKLQDRLEEWKENFKKIPDNNSKHESLPRRALLNSFGAGGSCASMVIEEYNEAYRVSGELLPQQNSIDEWEADNKKEGKIQDIQPFSDTFYFDLFNKLKNETITEGEIVEKYLSIDL